MTTLHYRSGTNASPELRKRQQGCRSHCADSSCILPQLQATEWAQLGGPTTTHTADCILVCRHSSAVGPTIGAPWSRGRYIKSIK